MKSAPSRTSGSLYNALSHSVVTLRIPFILAEVITNVIISEHNFHFSGAKPRDALILFVSSTDRESFAPPPPPAPLSSLSSRLEDFLEDLSLSLRLSRDQERSLLSRCRSLDLDRDLLRLLSLSLSLSLDLDLDLCQRFNDSLT